MMMHFLDEIDAALEAKIAAYLRAHQAEHGGWPLYYGGEFDISCTVKAYYALKLAGDDIQAPHMVRARNAILQRGGAARANVLHAHRAGAVRPGAVARRAVHSGRDHAAAALVPVPSRQGVVLVAHGDGAAVHPVHAQAAGQESAQRSTFASCSRRRRNASGTISGRKGLVAEGVSARSTASAGLIDPLIPKRVRERATRKAESWILERLNGEDGLGAIFPAMVNALEVMVMLGYAARSIRGACHGQARAAKAAGGGAIQRLLPALRIADLGHGAGLPGDAGDRRRARARLRPTRALDWLQDAAAAGRAGRLAGRAGRSCRAAAGRFSSPTATTRISTTPRWSSGPCTRRAIPSATRQRAPRARLAGGHAERERRLRRLRRRQHPLLPEQHSVRRSRRVARSAHQRCHRARRHRAGARRRGRRTSRRWSAPSTICAASRRPTAPGSAAGAPTTFTAPGRC